MTRTSRVRLTFEALEDRTTPTTIYALTPFNSVIGFDSGDPTSITSSALITGLGAGERVVGIDFRPRTGQLYAVTTPFAGANILRTYTLNPLTGQAALIGAAAALPVSGSGATGIDFNPTVDRIRYVNANDENARIDPNTGALAGNDTDLNPAATTDVIAAAYDRNFDRASAAAIPTTLYVINRNGTMLAIQGGIDGTPSPNGGAVTNVGSLGVTLIAGTDAGFDIIGGPGGQRAFAALHTTSASGELYSINLSTGAATLIGQIGNGTVEVISIAAVPEGTIVTGSDAGAPGDVRVFDSITRATSAPRLALTPFDGFTGGVRVASADVNGDGVDDVIAGAGPGAPGGHVKVFSGVDGSELRSFFAFEGFTGGVNVAGGDVDGDGFDDIIVGAEAGAPGGHVKVFSGRDGSVLASFFAFEGFGGGVRVGAADLDRDGRAEIIVGAGPGAPGGHVKVFGGAGAGLLASFFAFEGFTGGVFVAGGDVDGDGRAEVIVGAGGGPGGHVRTFTGPALAPGASFLAYEDTFTGGTRVGVADVNQDGRYEILVAPGPGRAADIRAFDGATAAQVDDFFTYDLFPGGAFVGGARGI